MIRRIVLSIFCCLLAYPFLVARQRDWSLPTPEADLPVALIPYPKEIVRLKGDLAFSSLRIENFLWQVFGIKNVLWLSLEMFVVFGKWMQARAVNNL